MNLTVLDADQVGVQACWYGNAYGDTDYVHTDRPSTGSTVASVEYGESSDLSADQHVLIAVIRLCSASR
jgi:hypothetical protein